MKLTPHQLFKELLKVAVLSAFLVQTLNKRQWSYQGPAQMQENRFGIPEPSYGNSCDILKIDYVFVPLLCFDAAGNRVGYGQGFYDKFLSSCRDNCIKIGLSHFDPINKIEDCNEMDIKLDFCITPNKTYAFR